MTTGNDWIAQTRQYLMSGYQENRNKLAVAYTKGDPTLTFKYPMNGIREGARICIGTNTFYVWSINGQVAQVSGGDEDSTDANAPVDSLVRVSPRFTDQDIWNMLAADVNDLSSPANGLFAIETLDLTYNATVNGYDLGPVADRFQTVYEVKYLTPGPQLDNPRITTNGFRINRQANMMQYPSGISMQLFQPAYPGYNLRLVYKASFVMPTSAFANVSSTGLQPTAYDLPPIGAAIRLMEGREIKRNFTENQGDTRRASEVGPQAVYQSSRGLKEMRQRRIMAEAARLDALYPNYKE